MCRRHSIIAATLSLLIAAPAAPLIAMSAPAEALSAPAEELQKASFTPREMAHCMMKRFRAHRSESYRDAYNACKEQFDLARADSSETAMTEPAPVEAGKPQ